MQDLPDFVLAPGADSRSSSDDDNHDPSKTNGPSRFATQDVTVANGFGRGQRLRKRTETSPRKPAVPKISRMRVDAEVLSSDEDQPQSMATRIFLTARYDSSRLPHDCYPHLY